MKICRKSTCEFKNTLQPKSNFRKNHKNSDGLESYCKDCQSKRNEEYRKRNAEKLKDYEMRRREPHVQYMKIYDSSHKMQKIEYSKEYYIRNRETIISRNLEYSQNNKEIIQRIQRDYKRKLQIERPDYLREIHSKRRALLKKAIPKWANRDNIRLIYKEARKLESATGKKYHVDHDIPLSHPLVCGLHVENNLQILLANDNLEKNNFFDPDLFDGIGLSLDEILNLFE